MDKTETAKLLGNLSILYGRPKGDPEMTAEVWHELVKQYDYKDALKAVYDFARQDIRDYATFPAPGVIINIIEETADKKKKRLFRIWNGMYDQLPYSNLPKECQELCPEDFYERGKNMRAEDLIAKRDEVIAYLTRKQLLLEG